MFPKRLRDSKTGFHLLSSMHAKKYLKQIGWEREDYYFYRRVGTGLLCTYAVLGALWLYNETSPLEWWKLKPRPKEELELAHLYERRKFPCPCDEEAMKEFTAKEGMSGTTIDPKGMVQSDKDQKELESKNFDEEAQKLWLKMRNEVIAELQKKGIDVK